MAETKLQYYKRRVAEARDKAAASGDGPVRQAHERFANAYAERINQTAVARMTVDELLG